MALKKYYADVSVIDWRAKAKEIGIHPVEFLLCLASQNIGFLVRIK